jgi:copper resistance protein D
MIVCSEFALLLCLTMSMGFALLQVIPRDLDVKSEVILRWLKWMGNASIFFAFLSILFIANTFSTRFHLDFMTSFLQVLYGTNAGLGWIGILAANTLLIGLITFRDPTRERFTAHTVAMLVVMMLVSYAYARHVSSLDPVWGFFSQSIHVLGVAVWLGLLLMFGWFSGEHVTWQNVLKWFTPLSLSCLTAILVAGFFVMGYVAPEYVQSWILTYGQSLLVKHLLMLPLLTFAFINGFLYRYKVKKDPDFDPRPWYRGESLIATAILLVTSFMSQQAPPHEVSETLLNEKPSSLFLYWYQAHFDSSQKLHVVPNGEGLVLLLMSTFLFLLVGICYFKWKRIPVVLVSSAVLLGSISAYLAAMIMVR